MAPHPELSAEEAALSPMAVRDLSVAKTIVKRANDAYVQLAAAGARPAKDLSGPGYQALFAIMGVGMTLMMIWFFFWAKNGGFKWQKDDWEDYKSTVMRRKGPDGKTLSNATKSTILGGGSVVHGGSYGAESSVGYTDETSTNVDANDYRKAEEGNGGLRGGDGRVRKEKKSRRDNTNNTNDYNDPELRHYRHEKAARVGGLNRQADGHYTDYSGSQPSELGSNVGSNVSSAPLVKKTEKDPKKEAEAKKQRAKERMRKAKAAEKETARVKAVEAKERKEAQKAEARREKEREKEAYKKNKKTKAIMAPSEAPEMAEVTRPLTEYTGPAYTEYTAPSEYGTPDKNNNTGALTEYTAAYTEYTAPSDAGSPEKKTKSRRAPPSAAYSFVTGDDDHTVVSSAYTDTSPNHHRTTARAVPSVAQSADAESSYYSDYRPNADPSVYTSRTAANRASRSASRPKGERPQGERPQGERPQGERPQGERPQGARSRPTSRPQSKSPEKRHRPASTARPSRSQYAPAPSDIFTATNGEAHGHMSYPCHIPGLSMAGSVAASDSVSQAGLPKVRGGRDVMDGYRRGGVRAVGRRDSLSDSD